jgi:hypothetical protein
MKYEFLENINLKRTLKKSFIIHKTLIHAVFEISNVCNLYFIQ